MRTHVAQAIRTYPMLHVLSPRSLDIFVSVVPAAGGRKRDGIEAREAGRDPRRRRWLGA